MSDWKCCVRMWNKVYPYAVPQNVGNVECSIPRLLLKRVSNATTLLSSKLLFFRIRVNKSNRRKLMQERNKLGHNKPPKTIEEQINDQGRIKLSNSIIRQLKRKVDDKGNYVETVYSDTEKVGLKAKVNKGGSVSFFYQWYNKNKLRKKPDSKGRMKGGTDKQIIGQFPDWKVEAARSIVDKIKQGIRLGTDPKSTFEANKAIPTFEAAIAQWKTDVMNVSNAFRDTTKKDLEARFKVWFYLNPKSKKLQNYVLSKYLDLNIKEKQIHLITHDDIIRYHKAITNSGSPYMANRVLDDLKLIVKWAMKKTEWKITENFALLDWENERNQELHRTDMHKVYDNKELRIIRKEVMKRATLRVVKYSNGTTAKPYPRNYVALMAILASMFLGRRYRNEILNLKWSQIDIDEVILPRSKNSKKPVKYKTNVYVQWIFRKLREFGKYKFRLERKKRYHSQKGYVFPSTRESKLPYVHDIDKTWKAILFSTNLRKLPLYMLRHSWATNGLKARNNNIKDIMDAGGWKTLRMAELYSQIDEERNKETSESVARFIATGR